MVEQILWYAIGGAVIYKLVQLKIIEFGSFYIQFGQLKPKNLPKDLKPKSARKQLKR